MDPIYDLKLHEEYGIDNNTMVMRVPGGWIYTSSYENGTGGTDMSSCFVPFTPYLDGSYGS